MVRNKAVIGTGMIGTAFAEARCINNCIIYAAGTANSSCTRQSEFDRDENRLKESMLRSGIFVYVSTCSIEDKPYTHHKMKMEGLVKERGNYLIVRLPNVAGKSDNPHTLLNFLSSCVHRREEFDLFTKARRNVIDVMDVVDITYWLLRNYAINETVNVAAPFNYSVLEIVNEFEKIYRKKAVFNRIDSGDAPDIDTSRIADAFVDFSGDYLGRTLRRYYE
jgi:nucleoside-diphosphate-sugar epimerase